MSGSGVRLAVENLVAWDETNHSQWMGRLQLHSSCMCGLNANWLLQQETYIISPIYDIIDTFCLDCHACLFSSLEVHSIEFTWPEVADHQSHLAPTLGRLRI